MVKGRLVCFILPFRLKNRYTLIEQSAYLVLLKMALTNTIQLYNYIANNQSTYSCSLCVYAFELYNVYDVTVK